MREDRTAEVQKLTAVIKKAAIDFEKLYPKAAWKKLEREASAAFYSYIEKDKKAFFKELKEQEELRRTEEENK